MCAIRLSQLVLLLIDFSGYILLSTGASPPLPAPPIELTPLLTSPLAAPFQPAAIRSRALFVLAWKSFHVASQPAILRRMSGRRLPLYLFFGFGPVFTFAASVKPLNF